MTTYQPGDRVTVLSDDTELHITEQVGYARGRHASEALQRLSNGATVPESWLTLVAPATPTEPTEPTEPGTVVWDRDSKAWTLVGSESWSSWNQAGRNWSQLNAESGPLTTTQPGTIPAAAADDQRAAELVDVYTVAHCNATGGRPRDVAMRAVLANIRTWEAP